MKTTITKTKDREVYVNPNGDGHGHAEVVVRCAYTRPGYTKRTWDEAYILLTPAELRHIVNALESGRKSMFNLCPTCGVPAEQCDCMP